MSIGNLMKFLCMISTCYKCKFQKDSYPRVAIVFVKFKLNWHVLGFQQTSNPVEDRHFAKPHHH